MEIDDLIRMRALFDAANVPQTGRYVIIPIDDDLSDEEGIKEYLSRALDITPDDLQWEFMEDNNEAPLR